MHNSHIHRALFEARSGDITRAAARAAQARGLARRPTRAARPQTTPRWALLRTQP